MSCARQRSNRSCHRYRWASACGHSVAWGWDAAAWEWDAAWEAAARRACRTGAGCTDVVNRKKNPAKVGPWRGLRRAAQRGGLSRASSGACHANPQKRLCPVTGKATRRKFRSGVAFSAQSRPRFRRHSPSTEIKDEGELGGESVSGFGHAHHQLAPEQTITAVARLVRKVQLGGEHRLLRGLNLDVIVARAAGIERRQDRAKAIASGVIGKQVSAIAKAGIVVIAAFVRVP